MKIIYTLMIIFAVYNNIVSWSIGDSKGDLKSAYAIKGIFWLVFIFVVRYLTEIGL